VLIVSIFFMLHELDWWRSGRHFIRHILTAIRGLYVYSRAIFDLFLLF